MSWDSFASAKAWRMAGPSTGSSRRCSRSVGNHVVPSATVHLQGSLCHCDCLKFLGEVEVIATAAPRISHLGSKQELQRVFLAIEASPCGGREQFAQKLSHWNFAWLSPGGCGHEMRRIGPDLRGRLSCDRCKNYGGQQPVRQEVIFGKIPVVATYLGMYE